MGPGSPSFWCQARATRDSIGLRGEILAQYARDWIVSIEDISPFVREQYPLVQAGNWAQLIVPSEAVYSIADLEIAKRLQLSTVEAIV